MENIYYSKYKKGLDKRGKRGTIDQPSNLYDEDDRTLSVFYKSITPNVYDEIYFKLLNSIHFNINQNYFRLVPKPIDHQNKDHIKALQIILKKLDENNIITFVLNELLTEELTEELLDLILSYCNVNYFNEYLSYGNTLLLYYIITSHENKLSKIINKINILYIKKILEHGADPNMDDHQGNVALPFLVHYEGNNPNIIDIIKLFIDFKADLDIQDQNGSTALHYTTNNAYGFEIARFLLDNGADPNIENGYGETALTKIIDDINRNSSYIKQLNRSKLVRNDTDPDHPNQKSLFAKYKFFELLLDKGSDINNKKFLHRTNDIKILELLLKYGADINEEDDMGHTALYNKNTQSLIFLLKQDSITSDNIQKTIIDSFKNSDYRENWFTEDFMHEIKLLTEKLLTIDPKDPKNQFTILFEIISCYTELPISTHYNEYFKESFFNYYEYCEDAIDINYIYEGTTLLHKAVGQNLPIEIIKEYFIDRGSDVNIKNKHGNTILHLLLRRSNLITTDILKLLIDRGANIYIKNNKNLIPIIYYLRNRKITFKLEIIQILTNSDLFKNLPLGINFLETITWIIFTNYKNSLIDGIDPLPEILEIFEYFLSLGADINTTDEIGNSILHVICGQYFDNQPMQVSTEFKEKIIEFLIAHNINVKLLNFNRQTAIQLLEGEDLILRDLIFDRYLHVLNETDWNEQSLEHLRDPVMLGLFEDPCIASDGYTYSVSTLNQLFIGPNPRSPITNLPLQRVNGQVGIPNILVRQMVDKFKEGKLKVSLG